MKLNTPLPLPLAWPLPAWQGVGIAGTNAPESKSFLDCSASSLGELLKSLFPEPSYQQLQELRHLALSLEKELGEDHWPSICKQWPLPSWALELLKKWEEAPSEFVNWCDLRQAKWGHLRPLALISWGQASPWLNTLARLNLSLQEGSKAIEYATEIELMGQSEHLQALQAETQGSRWLQQLYAVRFPKAQAQMEKAEDRLKKIRWPQGVQGRWVRQGDRQALELRMTAASKEELERLNARLSSLKGKEELWT